MSSMERIPMERGCFRSRFWGREIIQLLFVGKTFYIFYMEKMFSISSLENKPLLWREYHDMEKSP